MRGGGINSRDTVGSEMIADVAVLVDGASAMSAPVLGSMGWVAERLPPGVMMSVATSAGRGPYSMLPGDAAGAASGALDIIGTARGWVRCLRTAVQSFESAEAWSGRAGARRVLFVSAARPPADAEGGGPDWLRCGRRLRRAGVEVWGVVEAGAGLYCAPYFACMAHLTLGGVVSSPRSRSVGGDVLAVIRGSPPASAVRLRPDHAARLDETADEGNAGYLLSAVTGLLIDGIDTGRISVAPEFRGLVRCDADNARARLGTVPSVVEAALRDSYSRLRREVDGALGSVPEEAADGEVVDVVTMAGIRTLCRRFVESRVDPYGSSLAELFYSVSGIVVGPAMCCPFTRRPGGRGHNYQSPSSLKIRAVMPGYTISYASFMGYERSAGGASPPGRCARREDLCSGVPDLLMRSREFDVTGVLPLLADGSALHRAVMSSLGATGWLDAVAWHSACRHILSPPDACAGMLRAAAAAMGSAAMGVRLAATAEVVGGRPRAARRNSPRACEECTRGVTRGPMQASAGPRQAPSVGSRRFSARLAEAADEFRRVSGLPAWRPRGESMAIEARDVAGLRSPGAAVIRKWGTAEFVSALGGWTPVRVGPLERVAGAFGRDVWAIVPEPRRPAPFRPPRGIQCPLCCNCSTPRPAARSSSSAPPAPARSQRCTPSPRTRDGT